MLVVAAALCFCMGQSSSEWSLLALVHSSENSSQLALQGLSLLDNGALGKAHKSNLKSGRFNNKSQTCASSVNFAALLRCSESEPEKSDGCKRKTGRTCQF